MFNLANRININHITKQKIVNILSKIYFSFIE